MWCTGQDKDRIHIADPDPGVKLTKLPRERFEEEWTGVTLFMAPSPATSLIRIKRIGLLSFIPILVKQRGFDYQYRFGNTLGNLD